MNARIRFFLISTVAWLMPVVAWANDHGEEAAHEGAHDGGHSVFTAELGWQTFSFLALIVILVKFGAKPIGAFLVARRARIEHDMVEAKAMKEKAEAIYNTYSARLAKLDDEIDQVRAEMVKAGELERDRIVAEAETKASRMRRDTQFIIEQQMKQLSLDLRREATLAAVAAAEKALRTGLNDADQKRLADDFLARLKQTDGAKQTPRAAESTGVAS